MSNKFIEKARQFKNTFASYDELQKYSIYNYQLTRITFSFKTIYRFNEAAPPSVIEENNQSNLSQE